MNFQEYQEASRKTALYPKEDKNFNYALTYPTMGLTSEAGEVAGKIKKVLRDKGGIVSEEIKHDISKELGDVLWYVAQIATELGLSLDDVAKENIEKLYSRLDRGKLGGSGDDR